MSEQRQAKLSAQDGVEWVCHRYDRVYWLEEVSNGGLRLVAATSDSQVEVLLRLAECLPEPVALLWVLHTARATGFSGRYQSPQLRLAEAADGLIRDCPLF